MGLSAANKAAVSTREAYLAELRTKVGVIRAELDVVVIDPAGKARDRLAERLGALAVRAASLDDSLLADELSSCRAAVQGVGVLGRLDAKTRTQIENTVDRIEAYVLAEIERDTTVAPKRRANRVPIGPRRSVGGTLKVLVVGSQPVADSLLAEDWSADDENAALHIEQLQLSSMAHHDVAARMPEVVVVDADHQGSRRMVERLMGSETTEEIPIIVVGRWERAEDAAPFIALGVARTLPKPVSPSELRRSCYEVGPGDSSAFEPLGPMCVDELGSRLTEELHRGLCDAADGHGRGRSVDLGTGDEVLTVMWDAIARIRELVSAKSKGSVRFAPVGPVTALPRANWLRGSTRRKPGDRAGQLNEIREGSEGSLTGCVVVVAEDDLSTNWFISGVLKEAGATVHSAYNGHKALDAAYRDLPDLVLSDVVMPELDGYTLCRAIKRDVLLRSVPVVLLSWKQDLLQRMRELGAGADGYLLKEASGDDILQRVLEVLRPRRAVAERIAAGGTARGRLDGLTAHALLKIVGERRGNGRVSIRDAHYLYEIELRAARPVLATRTSNDGTSERGLSVMAALVGIGDGRFGVSDLPEGTPYTAELNGSLEDQLLEPIARVRATQALISGAKLLRVDKVCIDDSRMTAQMMATPEPTRGLLRALVAGASPRELVQTGRASSELLEHLLCDAARQSAVTEVHGPSGVDLLTEAVAREIAVLSGAATDDLVRASHAALTGSIIASETTAMPLLEMVDDPPPRAALLEEPTELVESSAPVGRVEPSPVTDDAFDDAFDDECGADSHEPSDVDFASFVSNQHEPTGAGIAGPFGRRSLPPEPLRGETPVLASAMEVTEHARHYTPILSKVGRDDVPAFAQLDEDSPEPPAAKPPSPPPPVAAAPAPAPAAEPVAVVAAKPPREAAFSVSDQDAPRVPRLPRPSAWAPQSADAPKEKKLSRFLWPLLFGLLGIALAIGARWYREHRVPAPPPPMQQAPQQPTQVQQQGLNGLPAPPPMQGTSNAPDPQRAVEPATEIPLSKQNAAKLKAGEGLLEVVAGRDNEVKINGNRAGVGPVLRIVLPAQPAAYEVRVKMKGEERVRYVVVQEGKHLRLRVAPPWSR